MISHTTSTTAAKRIVTSGRYEGPDGGPFRGLLLPRVGPFKRSPPATHVPCPDTSSPRSSPGSAAGWPGRIPGRFPGSGPGVCIDDWFLAAAERGNPATRLDARHSGTAAWSAGNEVRPLIHGAAY